MNVHVPDCYLVDDLLIFNDITRGVICQGIDVSMPDQTNVEVDVLNALESDLRTFVANLQEGERLQVHFYKDSDYGHELERYQKITEKGHMCRFSRRHRTERYQRYVERMENDRLIQSNLRFYISTKIQGAKFRGGLSRREHYERIVNTYKQSFDQRVLVGDQLLKSYGGGMRALDGVGHLRELLRYFGPSLSKLYLAEDILGDPHANLMQLARAGSASPLEGADRGFFLDGNYFRTAGTFNHAKANVHGHDADRDRLSGSKLSRCGQLLSAIGGEGNSQNRRGTRWEIATMNYYNAAIPGWSFDPYDDFTHKLDDVNLVDLLPIGGTPKGDLEKAEASLRRRSGEPYWDENLFRTRGGRVPSAFDDRGLEGIWKELVSERYPGPDRGLVRVHGDRR